MADEDELTPEEKLLRVIQKGDSPPPDADAAVGGSAVFPEADTIAETAAIASGIPMAGRGLTTLNRALAAAAVLFLLLAGYETYLNLPANANVYPAETLDIGKPSADAPTVSISETRNMFANRRIFGMADRPSDDPAPKPVNPRGWRAYASENLALMGTSDVKRMQDGVEKTVREAIMMDNKLKKMHFLRAGSTLMLAEQEVTVANVAETVVELKMGDETLRIE